YEVPDFTLKGLDQILRHIFKRPYDPPSPIGAPPHLLTRGEEEQARLRRGQHRPAPVEGIAAEFGRALTTFAGRQAALEEITRWLRDVEDRSSRFVTSGPGSGKTALLGLVAHLGRGHQYMVGVTLPPACLPPKNSVDCALYIRNMVPATILATLAQAAGMPSGEIARTVSTR